MAASCIVFTDNKGIGRLRLIGSRDLSYYHPEPAKRVRILRRADGYYVQFCIKLDPRLTVSKPLTPSQKAVGIDVGLKYFLADSQGNVEPIPQYYEVAAATGTCVLRNGDRKAEKRLKQLNRQTSKKFRKGKPQSRNYQQARQRYARQHLRVSRQREENAKRVALRLIQSNDLVAYVGEACTKCIDLNVAGLVENRHLSKSISDAGWTLFRRWLDYLRVGRTEFTHRERFPLGWLERSGQLTETRRTMNPPAFRRGRTSKEPFFATVGHGWSGMFRRSRLLTNSPLIFHC